MAVVAACLGVMAAAAALLPCPDPKAHGARLVLCLLAIESVLLAVASPFLAARGSGAWLRLVFAPLAAVPLLSLVLCAVASRGNVPLARLAWCQAFLLAFACLVAALTLVLRSLRLRDSTAQAAATVVALLMLGQVFFANALVEAAPGPRARMLVVDATLWTNPWLIVGGSILEADPLRSEKLYEWSVIIYYGFRYPASTIASLPLRALLLTAIYAAVAAALHSLAWLLRRCRQRARGVHRVDTPCPD